MMAPVLELNNKDIFPTMFSILHKECMNGVNPGCDLAIHTRFSFLACPGRFWDSSMIRPSLGQNSFQFVVIPSFDIKWS